MHDRRRAVTGWQGHLCSPRRRGRRVPPPPGAHGDAARAAPPALSCGLETPLLREERDWFWPLPPRRRGSHHRWGVGRGGPGREGRWRPLRPPPHPGHGKLRPASSSPVHPRFGREACWERGRQEKPDCGYASSLCWDRRRGPLWPHAGAGPHSPRDFCASCLATLQNCSRSSRHILDASTLAPLSSLGSASMLTTDRRIFSTLCTGLHRSALLS